METTTFDVPVMYADHHVVEVRRILFELPGVENVYASSSFRAVEVEYDPEKIPAEELRSKLEEVGYMGELVLPVESDAAAYLAEDTPSYFRHTEVYEAAQEVVSFAQNVDSTGRPLWNCPGMGVIKTTMEE